MTIRSNTWGFATWGVSRWGRSLFGVPAIGNIVSDALVASINQTTRAGLGMSATVTIDGTDASADMVSFSVKTTAFGAARIAEITFGAAEVALLAIRKSIVEISVSYVVGSESFNAVVFRGKPRIIKPTKNGADAAVAVSCFDLSRALDEAAPKFTTFTGSAQALIRSELTELDIEFVEFHMDDYTVAGLVATNYSTVRALINALANGKGKAYVSYDPDGIFRIYDATQAQATTWAIPLSGQASRASQDKSSGVYNRVTVANGAGLTQTYNDTAHQADNGILETSLTAPFCSNNTQLLAYATQYAKESQATEWDIETPINPFIMAGNRVGIETEDGQGITARVEESNISFSWPAGAWHRLVCREIPDDSEDVIVPSPTTELFNNKGYGWGGLFTVDGTFTPYYPEFTISTEKDILFVAMQHVKNSTAGTVTFVDINTDDEYGPFPLTAYDTPWDGWWYGLYDEPITTLPAGTYRIVDSETGSWLVFGNMSGNLFFSLAEKGAIARVGG